MDIVVDVDFTLAMTTVVWVLFAVAASDVVVDIIEVVVSVVGDTVVSRAVLAWAFVVLTRELAIVGLVWCFDDRGIFVEPMEVPIGFND